MSKKVKKSYSTRLDVETIKIIKSKPNQAAFIEQSIKLNQDEKTN